MSSDEKKYTELEAHYLFATDFHGRTWDLLDQASRTRDDDERMLDYAHASQTHWRFVGGGVQHERSEWLLSRVYAVLGQADLSLQHARRCMQILEEYKGEMKDVDFAFAPEALARAYALAGNKPEALKYIELAEKAAEAIHDQEDRDTFFHQFKAGNWNGLR